MPDPESFCPQSPHDDVAGEAGAGGVSGSVNAIRVREIVAGVMAELEIQESYLSWIVSLVAGAGREAPSCCGNACRPCTLTIDAAVAEARRRLDMAGRMET